jgi:transcriptional regulator with XRE-family HTH domain
MTQFSMNDPRWNDLDWPLGPVDEFVGRRIREVRSLIDVSPNDLAGALGVSLNELDQIESGERHLFPREAVDAAQFLHVTPMFFFIGFTDVKESALTPASNPSLNPNYS